MRLRCRETIRNTEEEENKGSVGAGRVPLLYTSVGFAFDVFLEAYTQTTTTHCNMYLAFFFCS